jgi:hypothetical protein
MTIDAGEATIRKGFVPTRFITVEDADIAFIEEVHAMP